MADSCRKVPPGDSFYRKLQGRRFPPLDGPFSRLNGGTWSRVGYSAAPTPGTPPPRARSASYKPASALSCRMR